MRAADVIARRLYQAGCRVAFGMPGGEVLTLVDALEAAGIRFVLVKHENAGGFMAEGVHHVDGAPAILLATVGPGALNAVNVVANAFQDKVPMIFLTGCVDEDEAQRYTHQVVDQNAVFAPITKASLRLNAGSVHIMADKAVNLAKEGRGGPVHIDVPIGVADVDVPDQAVERGAQTPLCPVAGADMSKARDWLSKAERPVMIAGLDILAERGEASVAEFCRTHNIPLITTYKAKGVLPESDALALGGAGLSPLADKTLIPFVEKADLVICAGYDPVEMRVGWRDVWDVARQNVIDISHEANSHYMHSAGINIVSNIAAALTALGAGITPNETWKGGEVSTVKTSLSTAFATEDVWGPGAVIEECRAALPADAIITADSGAHRILLSQMWTCEHPRTFLQSSGFCTMGCAIPLAMGAKLAAPDRQVVGFVGDAGMLMGIGELATATELGGNPIFVVFVDASLALIELKQRQRQLKNQGVDFDKVDFAAIAKAFGGAAHTVETRQDLQIALREAQTSDHFTLIAAVIERGSYDGRI